MSDNELDALVATLGETDWGPNVTDTMTRWDQARRKAATAIPTLRARIAELEQRLEIDPAQPYDGIETRDATIIALETYKENLRDEVVELRAKIAELEADRAEWIEVERLRIGKATPPTPPV